MIDGHKFGSFVVNGREYLGDIKIIGSKVRLWDRKKHEVNIDDVKDILKAEPEVIIVGTGNSGYLQLEKSLRDYLLAKRIKLFIGVNSEAIVKYNEAVSQRKNIGAIFHSTC